ncbi:MAG: hypothetical protein K8F92_08890 [Hyphomicrobium sp.]|uniref:hypothetical protein n=1 Tax=Hyphomicrobium sp. TaxID=82 RepID=UPI00132883FC|nr:hypothetical protein [Hyphomicrobium sp.]KAB2943531.1 MAG: hypothetical protein F9K20_02295 [Hyphomicrobium sp.]MBZ0209758.1 hypothetical protein [Hyphomicrobium sp.]
MLDFAASSQRQRLKKMIFDDVAFGTSLAATMARAYDEACAALRDQNVELSEAARKLMALRIMTAVQGGERNREQLARLAAAVVYDASQ